MAPRRLPVTVAKLDDEHASPRAMLGDFQEIDNTCEPGLTGKLRRDIGEGNLEDLRDANLAGRQCIPATDLHVWPLPQANSGGDLASTNAVAQRSDELHGLGG